ncbi:zinc-dependent metalloprotease [Timonella sp. A28]|uniref:zinc-dependent metalloprotease n=1 Tax=Timonella sp. A28 TaxID=3442640 RepID=UPI003EBAA228
MSTNTPGNAGTPGDPNPSQWEEIMRSLFGDDADNAIAELKARGIDPASLDGAGFPTDPAALAPLLDQVRQLLTNSSGGAVNVDVAHDVARQVAAQGGDPTVMAIEEREITQSLSVAELWLDAATELAPSGAKTQALSRAQWVELTLPAWQSLVEPVADSVAHALGEILKNNLPEDFGSQSDERIAFEISGFPGFPTNLGGIFNGGEGFDPNQIMRQIGAAVFGMQIGTAAGTLSKEVFGTTDIGVPLTENHTAALLPANIKEFAEGLDTPLEEIRLFLALREAAHARLFAHVPWLKSHLYGLIAAYARGITIDMDALEGSMRDIDPTNTEALQQALSGGVFGIESTPEQKATLARLETALALIEGWVEEVVAQAAIAHLPSSIPLREMIRRRRAAGGPAEQTFSALIGLELRPRRSRDAALLWSTIAAERGVEARDAVWEHPDLLPTELDLDDPAGYFSRKEAQDSEMSDLDAALAEIFSTADAEDLNKKNERRDSAGTLEVDDEWPDDEDKPSA